MFKIVFFNTTEDDETFFRQKCEDKYEPFFVKKSLNEKTIITNEIKDAEVISCFTTSSLTSKILEKFVNLKVIILRCVGFNNIDIEYCKKKNIKVLNAKGYGNRTVAEFTLGLILDLTRNISKSYIELIDNKKDKSEYTGYELFGKTLGIIGVGSIGQELVKIADGLQMKILGFDPNPNEDLIKKYELKYVSLEELISNSDFISINTPLTKDNYHLLNEECFSNMKKNTIIVNTARGEIIDTKALYKALSENKIRGAALDVLEFEEETNSDNILYDMDYLDKETIKQILLNHEITNLDNVIVTPHIAYDSIEAKNKIKQITMENIDNYFSGIIKNNVY